MTGKEPENLSAPFYTGPTGRGCGRFSGAAWSLASGGLRWLSGVPPARGSSATAEVRQFLAPLAVTIANMKTGDWNIHYRDRQGAISWRRITVLEYRVGYHGQTQVRAWCHLRNEERTFTLSHILSWSPASATTTTIPEALPRFQSGPGAPPSLPQPGQDTAGQTERPRRLPWGRIVLAFVVLGWLANQLTILAVNARTAAPQRTPPSTTPAPTHPQATSKPAVVAKKQTTAPKPVPRKETSPRPTPVPRPDPSDLAGWSDASLEAESERLHAIIERELERWMQETDQIGFDFDNPDTMRLRNDSFARYHARTADTQAAWLSITSEQTRRLLAEYRRQWEAESREGAEQTKAQEVALRKRSEAERQAVSERGERDIAFTRVTGNRSLEVLELFARADQNGDGQLDWDEIRSFQKRLYASCRYQRNNTALSPDQFVAQGGGDCDDWALMTVGMLQYWGVAAYVGCFQNPDNPSVSHAVALVPVSTIPNGFRSYHLADWKEYHIKQPLPDGDYVPIDYTAVGDITNAMGSTWKLIIVCEAVRMYGEGW